MNAQASGNGEPGPGIDPVAYSGPVIAAVIPGQPEAVVRHAASLALCFGTSLVCAYVDVSAYTARSYRDGEDRLIPINPDALDGVSEVRINRIREELAGRLSGINVSWELRGLAGEPAHELSILADREDASMIVVGTRRPGLGKRLEELVEGSVAAHLAHHQPRPVLVVPLHPQPYGGSR